jgi:uncharacterized protein YndB with AHSA1/START domain
LPPRTRRGGDALSAPQGETSLVEREIRIEAAAETIFPFFTDPQKLVRWLGLGATLDPRPGGAFRVNTFEDYFIEGEYVAVEPHSRVVFTWGFQNVPDGQTNPLPPGSSTVAVELVPDGAATMVRLTHRVAASLVNFHSRGWDNYLRRLALVATGQDPGPDRFLDYLASVSGPPG